MTMTFTGTITFSLLHLSSNEELATMLGSGRDLAVKVLCSSAVLQIQLQRTWFYHQCETYEDVIMPM